MDPNGSTASAPSGNRSSCSPSRRTWTRCSSPVTCGSTATRVRARSCLHRAAQDAALPGDLRGRETTMWLVLTTRPRSESLLPKVARTPTVIDGIACLPWTPSRLFAARGLARRAATARPRRRRPSRARRHPHAALVACRASRCRTGCPSSSCASRCWTRTRCCDQGWQHIVMGHIHNAEPVWSRRCTSARRSASTSARPRPIMAAG